MGRGSGAPGPHCSPGMGSGRPRPPGPVGSVGTSRESDSGQARLLNGKHHCEGCAATEQGKHCAPITAAGCGEEDELSLINQE